MTTTIRIERSTTGAPTPKGGLAGAFGMTEPGAIDSESVEINVGKSTSLDEAARVAAKAFNATHGIIADGRTVETELSPEPEPEPGEPTEPVFTTFGGVSVGAIVIGRNDTPEDVARKVNEAVTESLASHRETCAACGVDHGAEGPAETGDTKGEPKLSEF